MKIKPDINKHAIQMMYMFRQYKIEAGDDTWKNLEYRQAYRDSLESMKVCKLIKEYHLGDFTITTNDDRILTV
jgi:hypothetical protein